MIASTSSATVLSVEELHLGDGHVLRPGEVLMRDGAIADSEFSLGCHRIILALGQSPDLSVFPEGTEVREGEREAEARSELR